MATQGENIAKWAWAVLENKILTRCENACVVCNGKGKVKSEDPRITTPITCTSCRGTGTSTDYKIKEK